MGHINKYAKLDVYDKDGKFNKINPRILKEEKFIDKDGTEYKSASFDESLSLDGDKGLIATYYSSYQLVLLHPVVITCCVYLKDAELATYREVLPVFINGIYYMPITVTVQPNGLAICKLIKMPPRDIEKETHPHDKATII